MELDQDATAVASGALPGRAQRGKGKCMQADHLIRSRDQSAALRCAALAGYYIACLMPPRRRCPLCCPCSGAAWAVGLQFFNPCDDPWCRPEVVEVVRYDGRGAQLAVAFVTPQDRLIREWLPPPSRCARCLTMAPINAAI